MNVLIVSASPLGAGSITFALARRLVTGIFPDADCRTLHLAEVALPACDGQLSSVVEGVERSGYYPALAPVYEAMKLADLVVFASPVHNFTVSALLKNLIDLMVFEAHRPSFMGKHALLVATAMGAGQDKVFRYLGDVVKSWGFRVVGRLGANSSVMAEPWYEARLVAAINQLSQRVPAAMTDPRPRVSLYELAAFKVWRLVVELNREKSPLDHRHWTARGLLEAPYYYPCRAIPPARWLSSLIVGFIRRGIRARKLKPQV